MTQRLNTIRSANKQYRSLLSLLTPHTTTRSTTHTCTSSIDYVCVTTVALSRVLVRLYSRVAFQVPYSRSTQRVLLVLSSSTSTLVRYSKYLYSSTQVPYSRSTVLLKYYTCTRSTVVPGSTKVTRASQMCPGAACSVLTSMIGPSKKKEVRNRERLPARLPVHDYASDTCAGDRY